MSFDFKTEGATTEEIQVPLDGVHTLSEYMRSTGKLPALPSPYQITVTKD